MPPQSAFRHHDHMPAGVTSPLYRQLVQEWVQLNTLTSAGVAARRWGQLEPDLAGYARPRDLVDAIDQLVPAEQDVKLLALIRLAQDGHQLAGRVVLQLMLPKLGRMTNRTSGTSSDNAFSEDRRHITVAEFWAVLASYPVSRRPRKVAANLALETLHRITQGTRGPRADLPVDPVDLTRTHPDVAGAPEIGSGIDVDADLAQVIAWAVSVGTISADDGRLLTLVYLSSRTGTATEAAAATYGLNNAAIRQRCSRARRRLVAAVRAELASTYDFTRAAG
jgi:hypothetical protein